MEFRNKLFPGVKEGQSSSERLKTYNTERAITLTVTTRGIGFSTFYILQSIYEFNNVPIRGSIYQLYRVALAAFECKVIIANRKVHQIQDVTDYYQRSIFNNDLVVAAEAIVLPDQLASIINSVGNIRINEKQYVPKIGKKNYTRNGIFIPQSEQVSLSNLRETVESLANRNLPVADRQRFYENNSIPGAQWIGVENNDPVLTNPDEIMPAKYGINDLEDDIEEFRPKLNFFKKKAPQYYTKGVSHDPGGTKAMLVCNEQCQMRLPDLVDNRQWEEYFLNDVRGNIDKYFNLERLTTGEQLEGNVCLLGESPITQTLRYPVYVQRDRRVCCETSALRYKSAKNIKYT